MGAVEDDDTPTPWAQKQGITKRKKPRRSSPEGSMDTPMRSQKELYVDYDKLAEIE